ncbi:MAG: hypothetical protein ABIQ38_08950 [Ilumatobacteraceae bacterium]
MNVLSDLLALQKTDIAISQARHRLSHLSQIDIHARSASEHAEIMQQSEIAVRRHSEAQREIANLETESHQLDVKSERLKKQLRSVIAIREVEALQHEIANCEESRSLLDDRELALLELVDKLSSEIETLRASEQSASNQLSKSLKDLQMSQLVIRQEIQQLVERRSATSSVIPERHLTDYESKRKHISGGAVAELHGSTCQSCHLDIARGELDAMKKLPADEFPECPNCGCYLVI